MWRYHKPRNHRRHSELTSKYNVALKTNCKKDCRNLKFMVTVYKSREIAGKTDLSEQLKKDL